MNLKSMEKQIVLQNKISEIPKLAEFIEGIGQELNLPVESVFNLNLALEEAVTNIIFYAYPKDEIHLIDIHAESDKFQLEFRIIDNGKPFDPTKVPDVDVSLSAEEREIGGLGIFLLRKMMDNIYYQRVGDKNVLTLIKRL